MFTADLFERVVRTALVTFITAFSAAFAAPATSSWSGWKNAAVAALLAGGTAVGSAVLGLITKQFGPSTDMASVLPSRTTGSGAPLPPPIVKLPVAD